MAKYVKKWVEGCEQCAKDKRVPNATITPELLNLPNGERSITAEANSSDASENEAEYIITTDSPNDVNHAVHSRNERLNDDVSKRNEASKATSNGESDWSNYPQNQEKSLPDLSERQENEANFSERNSTNETDAHKSPKRGMILSCPKYRKMMKEKIICPRGGRYNLRPNPNPNYSEDLRY